MKLLLRVIFSTTLLVIGIMLLGRTHAIAAPTWDLDPNSSSVGFVATYSGVDVKGNFDNYNANINFHPEDLGTSHILIEIDTASLNTQSTDRDKVIMSEAFFDSPNFPKAIFEAKSFEKLSNLDFIAHGTLTLHGVTKELTLPFQAVVNKKGLAATGSTEVSRLEYGVGSGLWLDTAVIGEMVRITFAIEGQN